MKKEMVIPDIREIFFLPVCDGDCFEHGDFSDPYESSQHGYGSLELTVLLFPV